MYFSKGTSRNYFTRSTVQKKELPVAVAVAGDPLAASGGAAVQKVRHLAYSAALAPAAQIPSLGDAAQQTPSGMTLVAADQSKADLQALRSGDGGGQIVLVVELPVAVTIAQ